MGEEFRTTSIEDPSKKFADDEARSKKEAERELDTRKKELFATLEDMEDDEKLERAAQLYKERDELRARLKEVDNEIEQIEK